MKKPETSLCKRSIFEKKLIKFEINDFLKSEETIRATF
mgnify:CR=1 FL=1